MRRGGLAAALLSLFLGASVRAALGSFGYERPLVRTPALGLRSRRSKTTAAQDQRRARKARSVAREKARQRGRR